MKFLCTWLYAIDKYGFPPSLANTFKALTEMKELSFQYGELEGVSGDNLELVYDNRFKIKEHINKIGLEIKNFVPVIPELREFDDSKRQYGRDMFEKGLEVATTLATEFIQLDSFPPLMKCLQGIQYDSNNVTNYGAQWHYRLTPEFDWDKQWELLVENIKWAAQKANKVGLKLIIEPRVGEIISNTDSMLRLIDAVDEPNLGAILDTGHQYAQKEILPLSILKFNDRLFYLHLSDNDGTRNDHFVPGKGTIDWIGVFEALKRINYKGYAGLDIARVDENLDEAYLKAKDILNNFAKQVGFE
ncbi:MAG: sugar phosphate isomerase/epimerase [Atribacterota bacterium]|nr:sugar phosphate isomerase/epimerase [Atribacterota bacterium]MDD4896824.1 sugar phosphate isomerase/epimerase [Atribacterota bacterium]MDD5637777.1 sugar phosphate isomerase/epimerase [Atribacterota bacterium]